MRSPRKVVRVLLAFVVCSTIFADYWEYSRQYHGNPDTWMDVLRGTANAPQQYRIGVPWVADQLRRHGHMGLRHGFSLIDLFSAVVGVYLLFSLLERTKAYRNGSEAARWFAAAAFLFLTQYYFAWITWYQRPETMVSVMVMAATLWLVSAPLPFSKSAATVVAPFAMLALAAIQGFVRADVIFAFHIGILIECLTQVGDGFVLPRGLQALTSLACVLTAGGIQYTLMHVVYPHAGYGITPVVELGLNLTQPLRWAPFLLFMLPTAWVAVTLMRRRATLETPGLALAMGAAIYLAMWFVAGKIDEVRIFLPYALALVPLTCVCAVQRFLPAAS